MARRTEFEFNHVAALFGRILVGGFFLWAGIDAAVNLPVTIYAFMRASTVAPVVWALLTVTVEVVGGIALITNTRVRVASMVLATLIVVTTPFLIDFTNATQMAMFFKNMAIVGGLLFISAKT